MTSWIREAPRRKKPETEPGADPILFHALSEQDPAAEFNAYFYACLYSGDIKAQLVVADSYSRLTPNYPLIQSTFRAIQGITFSETRPGKATPLQRKSREVAALIQSFPDLILRALAKEIFVLRPDMQAAVDGFLASTGYLQAVKTTGPAVAGGGRVAAAAPSKFHLGVHVPTRPLTLQPYLSAIREFQKESGEATLNILVSAEEEFVLGELRRLGDVSWTFYTLPPKPGTVALRSRGPTARQRQEGYMQQLAEWTLLQRADGFVGSLASPLGKYIYLTRDPLAFFKSVDAPTFTPF